MKKSFIITMIALAVVTVLFLIFVSGSGGDGVIDPLRVASAHEQAGQRLEISFQYEKGGMIGSNQFAIWIEDADGNYVSTLYATNFTARTGHRTRPTSLARWVAKANPADMSAERIDAISGATPSAGNYVAVWDFTDKNGNRVATATYRYFVEATVSMNDDVLFFGDIDMNNEQWIDAPSPRFSNENNRHNAMISNVVAVYYPGEKEDDEFVAEQNGEEQNEVEL